MEKVKATSSGADRAQYEYLLYIRALRNLSTCRQQDKESVETFQDRLVSSIQNFKLVGGNLMPQTLVTRERDEDLSLSAAQAGVIVENKIIGVLMVEAACDKDFREYKRSLQNSMSEGNNRYPHNKAMVYRMLSKCKKPSASVAASGDGRQYNQSRGRQEGAYYRPARGIAFYQGAAPVAGPSIAGINRVTEENVDCWQCGRRGHRSNLCSNNADNLGGFQGMQCMFAQAKNASKGEKLLDFVGHWVYIQLSL